MLSKYLVIHFIILFRVCIRSRDIINWIKNWREYLMHIKCFFLSLFLSLSVSSLLVEIANGRKNPLYKYLCWMIQLFEGYIVYGVCIYLQECDVRIASLKCIQIWYWYSESKLKAFLSIFLNKSIWFDYGQTYWFASKIRMMTLQYTGKFHFERWKIDFP